MESVDVSDILGGFGPWQRDIFLLLFLASVPSAWHNLQMTFMAPDGMQFSCAPPPHLNLSGGEWANRSAPPAPLDRRCYVRQFWTVEQGVVPCSAWIYDRTLYKSTIIDEWNLVCDREWLISFSKSIYNIGYLVAVLIFGQFSDSIGRRPALIFSYLLNVVAGIVSAFAPSFYTFAALRFFTAVGGGGFYTVSFVILIELVSPQYRSFVGVAINFGWCLAFVSLPGVAWLVRDWFWLQLTLTLPKLAFISVCWMVPESPRWLLIRHERDRFRRTVQLAALKNGLPADQALLEADKILLRSEEAHTAPVAATVLDLFRTPNLRRNTLVLFYNWLVNSFIYFALSYNTGKLSLDPYLSFFLSGAVEFPAYLATIAVIGRMGRRRPLAAAMVVAGVACSLSVALPQRVHAARTVLSLVGKFCITATFATAYVYSAEIFPTVVRNVGLGTSSTIARIASALAPFVRELGGGNWWVLPDLLYSVLSVTSGLLVLLLPETNCQPFADTLHQAEHIGDRKQAIDDSNDETKRQNGTAV